MFLMITNGLDLGIVKELLNTSESVLNYMAASMKKKVFEVIRKKEVQ